MHDCSADVSCQRAVDVLNDRGDLIARFALTLVVGTTGIFTCCFDKTGTRLITGEVSDGEGEATEAVAMSVAPLE